MFCFANQNSNHLFQIEFYGPVKNTWTRIKVGDTLFNCYNFPKFFVLPLVYVLKWH